MNAIRDSRRLADRIQQRLDALNLTPRAASMRAAGKPDVIRNIFRAAAKDQPYDPRSGTMSDLATALDTSVAWLLEGQDEAREPAASTGAAGYKPPADFLGRRDLPVFAAVEGGAGEIAWGTEPIELVPRPWYVANAADAMAILVTGESMMPVIRPGQMVVVDPRLPPLPQEPAVFMSEDHGHFRATIKELRRSTATDWVVYQYNPPEGQEHEFKLPKAEWPKAQRVVGWFAGR